ncbi:hypothetical protein OKW35_003639 [Paraburkholderia sp. MM5477-R1]
MDMQEVDKLMRALRLHAREAPHTLRQFMQAVKA